MRRERFDEIQWFGLEPNKSASSGDVENPYVIFGDFKLKHAKVRHAF